MSARWSVLPARPTCALRCCGKRGATPGISSRPCAEARAVHHPFRFARPHVSRYVVRHFGENPGNRACEGLTSNPFAFTLCPGVGLSENADRHGFWDGVRMSDTSASATGAASEPWVEVTGSPRLATWLAESQVSLAFTTYQTGKLFLLGRHPEGRLAVFERTFNRAMGLWADGQTLWLSTLYQLWRFENLLRPGESYQGHDRLYVPKVGYTTGDLDIHDVAIDGTGRVVFVATGFGCLATLSERSSFAPLWRPPFLSKLTAEDRCHLNGLALADGRPRYVTAVSASDVVDGWRDRRRDGGIVMEVPGGRVITAGLSMPHSPRWYRDRLWLLNSGTGQFEIGRASGRERGSVAVARGV